MKRKSKKALHKKAWKLWSVWVRTRQGEYPLCYTCGRQHHWKALDAGHFIHGRLDFDERNIKPQCSYCNRHLHGNLGEYALRLVAELGEDGVKKLKADSIKKGNDYSIYELEGIIRRLGGRVAGGIQGPEHQEEN